MKTIDSAHMRAINSNLILKIIWHEKSISRVEIAGRTGLSRSTVSAIVNDLLEKNLVSEVGIGTSRGGRRPIILCFNDDVFGVCGVDIGATHVAVVITNLRGNVVASKKHSHPVQTDPTGTLKLVKRLISGCIKKAKLSDRHLVGIGIGVPSPVNPGTLPGYLSPLILPEWEGTNIVEAIRETFPLPVYIDNDANLGALAEHWWGVGVGIDNLAYIKIGTGVGAGLIVNGEIFRGSTGLAGEIGHTVIDPEGSRSIRGVRGCLTAFVGADALVYQAKELAAQKIDSVLKTTRLSVSTITEAALKGDRLAIKIIEDAGRHLGIATSNLLNLINPEIVVLGGAIAKAEHILIDAMRKTIREGSLWEAVADSRLMVSGLGEMSTAIGAATLVLRNALDDHSLFPSAQ